MAIRKLTKTAVDGLAPTDKAFIVYDAEQVADAEKEKAESLGGEIAKSIVVLATPAYIITRSGWRALRLENSTETVTMQLGRAPFLSVIRSFIAEKIWSPRQSLDPPRLR